MLESAVERHLRRRVIAAGGMTEKIAPTHAGMPDRLVLLPGGRMFLVELKTTTGQLSKIQQWWHGQAKMMGTEVVTLKGTEEVDRWLDGMA